MDVVREITVMEKEVAKFTRYIWLFLPLLFLSLADAVTTWIALDMGAREVMPLARYFIARYGHAGVLLTVPLKCAFIFPWLYFVYSFTEKLGTRILRILYIVAAFPVINNLLVILW